METIAVIFGGRSAEHDVSIITGLASIIKPLELTRKYKVEPIYIAKDGAWYSDPKLKQIERFTKHDISDLLRKLKPISLQLDGGLKIVKSTGIGSRKHKIKIDLVFPAMHGTYGEDGSLMGLLDMCGIPYVGCGVAASAIAMDKLLSKQLAKANDVDITKFVSTTKTEIDASQAEVVKRVKAELNYPVFIKPTHLGSSIGITRAANDQELKNGLEVAAHYDRDVIIEEEVANLVEVTLPIMGNEKPVPSLLEQPQLKAEDFFDFETKYLQGGKKGKGKSGPKGSQGYSTIPANIDKDIYAKAEATGLKIYKCFGLSGIARVDMLIDTKSRKVYFNEINPLPGGLYSHNWNKAGISNVELVEKLVGYA
ncbi:MAG TPA: D-alanine--D-alanine ligase, partial [Candidatus Saccharimonadales bacterium]